MLLRRLPHRTAVTTFSAINIPVSVLQPPTRVLSLFARRRPFTSKSPSAAAAAPSSPQHPPPSSSSSSSSSSTPTELYKDQNDTWVDRSVSPALQPYMKLIRIDRPIGTLLLMWPGWWSIALAAPAGALPSIPLLATFATGAFVMRSAGCTINDMWDQKYDAKVARTKDRPLASGKITQFQALTFLGGQLSVGLGILLSLNTYSIALGASSMALVVSYPFMKRVTYWPQLVLGFAMNFGVLLGWSAVHGSLNLPAVLPLYASGILWTIVYDTLYAHQDKDDDASLGLKSTALLFGDSTKPICSAMAVASAAGVALSAYAVDAGWPMYAAGALAGAHMLWQVQTADLNDRLNLNQRFVANRWVGAILFGGIALSKFL